MDSFLFKLCIIVPVICCFNALNLENNYGPFKLRIFKLTNCKGPKPRECGLAKVTADVFNETVVKINVVAKEQIPYVKAKIIGMSNGRRISSIEADGLCQHLQLQLTLEHIMKLTKDCAIAKGVHNSSLDLQKVINEYNGGIFVYGKVTYKSSFYSKNCNHFCHLIGLETLPK